MDHICDDLFANNVWFSDGCLLLFQSKHQKHQAFEAELAANSDRIQTVVGMGQSKSRQIEWIVRKH